MIFEDYALDTAVADSTSVEDITYAEIACELILQALACGSSVCLQRSLVALDEKLIKEEIVCGIRCDLEFELIAALGSGILLLQLCPLACLDVLGSELYRALCSCFLVNGKQCEMELLCSLAVHLNAVSVSVSAEEIKSL